MPTPVRRILAAGPMIVFGYDYLGDHTHGGTAPALLSFDGMRAP